MGLAIEYGWGYCEARGSAVEFRDSRADDAAKRTGELRERGRDGDGWPNKRWNMSGGCEEERKRT